MNGGDLVDSGKKEPQKATIIAVSFVNDEDELQLYDDILKASKGMKKSSWMKIAAREKLERESGINNVGIVHNVQNPINRQTVRTTDNQSQNGQSIVNSLDDLFK